MRTLSLQIDDRKEIFTAKTEQGYVGCVKEDDYVCFTVEVFDSALKAANRARSLQKSLRNKSEKKTESLNTNVKKASKKTEKKVAYTQKLYTLAETEAMPLLRFQEVWVITRENLYVLDCLDKENKRLVRYTPSKDKAKYYSDHEEAKMTMRVLKSVVGPGFDLMRFFVENEK